MAALTPAVVVQGFPAYCQRLENLAPRDLLRVGLAGNGDNSQLEPNTAEAALGLTRGVIADQALMLATRGFVEFEARGQTETNDTVVTLNLTDLLVNFPAGSLRRLDVDAYITADADAGDLRLTAIVAGGTTPLVAVTKLKGIEDAATATSEGGIRYSVAAGDFLASSLIVPTVLFEQNTNKIRLSFTGVTNLDMFWTFKIKIYPLIVQTFPVTD